MLSKSDIKDRQNYHTKHKVLDPVYILFAKIVPTYKADFEETVCFFYKNGNDKIYYFKIPERMGSGYVQGYVWKPKELKGVDKNNFDLFVKNLCIKGKKQKLFESIISKKLFELYKGV